VDLKQETQTIQFVKPQAKPKVVAPRELFPISKQPEASAAAMTSKKIEIKPKLI